MRIEILGAGCGNCRALEANARKAVAESGVKAEIVKIDDFVKIAEYGVLSLPAIVIDGEVKASGSVPNVNEIKKWLIR